MKKLLYITFVDFSNIRFIGVIKKIKSQIKVFEQSGYDVTLIAQYKKGVYKSESSNSDSFHVFKNYTSKSRRKFLTDFVIAELVYFKYSFSYIRFQFFCPNVLNMLRAMKMKGIVNLMEIPTFPYENELKKQGLCGFLKLMCDIFFRKYSVKYIDRFITYSNDTEIYGTKTINTINGVDLDYLPISKYKVTNELNLIAVASMMPWHGYDRLLKGIKSYGDKSHEQINVHFHLVGDGDALGQYKKYVMDNKLEDKVTFYGNKDGSELNEIFDKCSMGVSSLGLHRIGLNSASTLKAREYAARGLFVITTCALDFLKETDELFLNVPSEDIEVDIEKIVMYYKNNILPYKDQIGDRKLLIRECVAKTCSMKNTMCDIISYMQDNI